MKKILIVAIIGFVFFNCSKDKDEIPQIVGKWKLIESKLYGFEGENSEDYSKENIIYNFQIDGSLIVSGAKKGEHPNGKYEYLLEEDITRGTENSEILMVKINESKWSYTLNKEQMILSQAFVDGPSLIFTKNK